ncbi:MAG: DUF4242 domain-containing protein [Solirubrobacteraceae bacterium]
MHAVKSSPADLGGSADVARAGWEEDFRHPHSERMKMNTYVIRRKSASTSPEALGQVAERSKAVADNEFPDDIRWIRSYVIAEEDGTLGTVCVYEASSAEAVRKHAHRVGMPADVILDVADTVINMPDPTREPAAS